jgi:hypothetical protein
MEITSGFNWLNKDSNLSHMGPVCFGISDENSSKELLTVVLCTVEPDHSDGSIRKIALYKEAGNLVTKEMSRPQRKFTRISYEEENEDHLVTLVNNEYLFRVEIIPLKLFQTNQLIEIRGYSNVFVMDNENIIEIKSIDHSCKFFISFF